MGLVKKNIIHNIFLPETQINIYILFFSFQTLFKFLIDVTNYQTGLFKMFLLFK
jgi:hypothetical protein